MELARRKRRRRKRREVTMMSQFRENISTLKRLRLLRVKDLLRKINSSSKENN
jgi:hypothetical protein